MACAKHESNKLRDKEFNMQILYKDTISMIDAQLKIHQTLCNNIIEKYGF